MNTVSFASSESMEENGHGSDSDSNPEESTHFYQPISAVDEEGSLSDSDRPNSDDDHFHDHADSGQHRLPNGVSALSLGDGLGDLKSSEEEEDDEDNDEEEEREREAHEAAMRRAFREDERRRSAPLTPQNASRVMEAMRGVSFGGFPPDWARNVPEEQWIQRLRQLRQPPNTSA